MVDRERGIRGAEWLAGRPHRLIPASRAPVCPSDASNTGEEPSVGMIGWLCGYRGCGASDWFCGFLFRTWKYSQPCALPAQYILRLGENRIEVKLNNTFV